MRKMTEDEKRTVAEYVTNMNHEINLRKDKHPEDEDKIIEAVTKRWYKMLNNKLKGVSKHEVADSMMKEIRRQEALGLDLIA